MSPDSRTQLVEFSWYDGSPSSPVEDWLSVCTQYLPAAIPRRYGSYEPLPHRLDDPSAMGELTEEDDLVFFSTAKPCVAGSFSRSPGIWTTSLGILAPPFREPRLQSAVRELFVAYAELRGCFLATAEVVARVGWTGRSVWYDEKSQSTVRLDDREGRFLGLPPYPVWWTWYGNAYRELVEPHLDPSEVVVRPTGLFHQASSDTTRRSKLPDPLPADLRTHSASRNLARYPVPVRPAAVVPTGIPGQPET
jgi:hypothetical protein